MREEEMKRGREGGEEKEREGKTALGEELE